MTPAPSSVAPAAEPVRHDRGSDPRVDRQADRQADRRADPRALEKIAARLAGRHPDVPLTTISELLAASYARTRDAKVQDFRLLLAERDVRRCLGPPLDGGRAR